MQRAGTSASPGSEADYGISNADYGISGLMSRQGAEGSYEREGWERGGLPAVGGISRRDMDFSAETNENLWEDHTTITIPPQSQSSSNPSKRMSMNSRSLVHSNIEIERGERAQVAQHRTDIEGEETPMYVHTHIPTYTPCVCLHIR